MNVSYFRSASASKQPLGNYDIFEVLEWIRNGSFIDSAISVRSAIAKNNGDTKADAVGAAKRSVPAFTPSGTFIVRNLQSLTSYSQLVDIDIDNVPENEAPILKRKLASLPWILAAYVSISGTGVAAIARVSSSSEDHAKIAREIQLTLALDSMDVDPLIDFTRLRFISHDPDIYINRAAVPFDPVASLGVDKPFQDDRQTQEGDSDEYFSDEENIEFALKIVDREYSPKDGRNKFCYYFAKYCNRLGIDFEKTVAAAFAHCEKFPHPKGQAFRESEARLVVDKVFRSKVGDRGSQRKKKKQRKSRIRFRGEGGHTSHIPTFAAVIKQNPVHNAAIRRDMVFGSRLVYGIEEPPVMPMVLSFDGYIFCRAGDRAAILGQQKSGKSEMVSAMVAACLAANYTDEQLAPLRLMGFRAARNPIGKAIILIDSEQSKTDVYEMGLKIQRRAGIPSMPDHFVHMKFRELDIEQRAEAFVEVLQWADATFGGIFAIFVDGPVDFLKDPNNFHESASLSTLFLQLASHYHAPIVEVIHENPHTFGPRKNSGKAKGKARGHYGSESLRKITSSIHSGWDTEMGAYHVTFPDMRKAPRNLQYFMNWSKQYGGLVRVGYGGVETPQQFQKKIARRGFLVWLVKSTWPAQMSVFSQSDFIYRLSEIDKITDELHARSVVQDMMKHNLIQTVENNPQYLMLGDGMPFDGMQPNQ